MSAALELHHALRAAVTLRDKVVVLRLVAAAYGTPDRVANLAAHLSLLRALGLRLVVILDAPGPAVRLAAAIAAQGQRALMLPATGIIGVPQPVAGAPALPTLPVTVDPVPLGQLTTIGYIPLLLLPVTDQAGAALELAADEVAAVVGLYLDAALLVFERADFGDARPLPLFAAGRQTVVTGADSPAGLSSAILLAGWPGNAAPNNEPTNESAKEPAKKSDNEPANESAKGPAKKSAKGAAKKSAKADGKRPSEKANQAGRARGSGNA